METTQQNATPSDQQLYEAGLLTKEEYEKRTMHENAIVPVSVPRIPSELAIVGNPSEIVQKASAAAKALKLVVDKAGLNVNIQGREYLRVEAWQTMARFHGVVAGIKETKPIIVNGKNVGWEATSILFHQGQEIPGADASCMRDEPNWATKPEFQLRSMAQTRAIAKALRNAFAWVVTLAGYEATPAEEMDGTQPAPERTSRGYSGKSASTKQVNFVKSLNKQLGHDSAWLEKQVGKPLSKLTSSEASGLIETMQKKLRTGANADGNVVELDGDGDVVESPGVEK